MSKRISSRAGAIAAILAGLAAAPARPQSAPPVPPPAYRALARDILGQLIGINSTHAHGSTVAAQALAARLIAGGFAPADVQVLVPADHPLKGNVVVRLRGTGKGRPILYIGHLDVVEARAEDWTYDPFHLTEKDGWLYGRGTIDMKGQDTAVAVSLIRLKQEGFKPDRDIIAAFTADEEAGGDFSGIDWLLKTHRDLIDAALVINPDGTDAAIKNGRKLYIGVQTAEKVYVTYQIEATDKGGHSSRPTAGNPIYRIARALGRLEAHPFGVHLTDTTRAYFRARAALETGQVRADMLDAASPNPSPAAIERLSGQVETNVLMRTTCVATVIDGGQGESALPERAKAIIQCRVIPGEAPAAIQSALNGIIADPTIKLTVFTPETPSPESPPSKEVIAAVQQVADGMWPNLVVLPYMSAGASDSAFTRSAGIPSYGVDGNFSDIDDPRAHGRDERTNIESFNEDLEFTYRLMKLLAGGG